MVLNIESYPGMARTKERRQVYFKIYSSENSKIYSKVDFKGREKPKKLNSESLSIFQYVLGTQKLIYFHKSVQTIVLHIIFELGRASKPYLEGI